MPVNEAARKNGARLSAKPRETAQNVSNTMALAVDIYLYSIKYAVKQYGIFYLKRLTSTPGKTGM